MPAPAICVTSATPGTIDSRTIRSQAQDIVLTVPASFDEIARRLTVEAARLGGLPRVRLVEEPQAACYDWLARHAEQLERALADVRTLLVCDVGGGTTDLTLIRVDRGGGHPQLVRIGIADHLMLGGDNMDLALAHLAEKKMLRAGNPLSAAQFSQLVQQCRGAKERMLEHDAPETASVTILGTGARLIGQARSTELTRDEVEQLVVDGFFPETRREDRPQRRRSGIVEFGLPYAADPAVTRQLAAFLADHAHALRTAVGERILEEDGYPVPDAVLLNGGVFRSEALSHRLLQVLGGWRGEVPLQLHNDQPDLAVARGAVAYALARRGHGMRIGGGAARSLLLLVEEAAEQKQRAVCLLPRGSEEGQELRLTDRVFSLRLGQPVRFNLVATTSERNYKLGEASSTSIKHTFGRCRRWPQSLTPTRMRIQALARPRSNLRRCSRISARWKSIASQPAIPPPISTGDGAWNSSSAAREPGQLQWDRPSSRRPTLRRRNG